MSGGYPETVRVNALSLPMVDLGSTGLRVSRLGFGAGWLRGPDREHPLPDEVGIGTVRAALDHGVTYIDTAPLYGEGISEELIGRALRGHPRAQQVVVATKIGFVPTPFDYSADATMASVHASLRRLGLERLPLVQVHEIREEIYDAVFRRGGTLDGLRRLQADGLIEHLGVTGSEYAWIARALKTRAFETVLIWKHADLLDDALLRRIAPLTQRLGVAVIAGTPFAGGLLAGRPGVRGERERGYIQRRDWSGTLAYLEQLEALCDRHGVDLPAAALQFVLRHQDVATTIPGARTSDEVIQNIQRCTNPLPDEFWAALDALRAERSSGRHNRAPYPSDD